MKLEEFLEEWRNDSDRVLVHTSGSTGEPKPLWVEKHRMEASARITCDFLGLQQGDTALLCMPLDYIAGKMMVVRALVRNLKLIVVEPTGHPLATLEGGLRGAPVFAAMVPMQVYNSLQVPEERERLKQIRHLIIGGGAIDEALAAGLKDFPNNVWSTYGMTETLSHIALRRLNGPEASEWYTPFESVQISQCEDGCLVIDAPLVCKDTLVTNDIVELAPLQLPSVGGVARSAGRKASPAGAGVSFRILGRKDNVVCSGGIKIQMEEVERALRPFMRVPYLLSKRKDGKFGEVAVLLTESDDLETIRNICREHLPKYWQPRYFVTVAQIPMTETGKPARKQAEALARQ